LLSSAFIALLTRTPVFLSSSFFFSAFLRVSTSSCLSSLASFLASFSPAVSRISSPLSSRFAAFFALSFASVVRIAFEALS